jgi:Bardet-Biedl syndrome 2 protein
MDGVDQLICCSVEGEVRGYKPAPAHLLEGALDRNVNQEGIRDMTQRKQVDGGKQ